MDERDLPDIDLRLHGGARHRVCHEALDHRRVERLVQKELPRRPLPLDRHVPPLVIVRLEAASVDLDADRHGACVAIVIIVAASVRHIYSVPSRPRKILPRIALVVLQLGVQLVAELPESLDVRRVVASQREKDVFSVGVVGQGVDRGVLIHQLFHGYRFRLRSGSISPEGLVLAPSRGAVAGAPVEVVVPVEVDAAVRVPVLSLPPVVLENIGDTVRIHHRHNDDVDVINPVCDFRIGAVILCEILDHVYCDLGSHHLPRVVLRVQ